MFVRLAAGSVNSADLKQEQEAWEFKKEETIVAPHLCFTIYFYLTMLCPNGSTEE